MKLRKTLLLFLASVYLLYACASQPVQTPLDNTATSAITPTVIVQVVTKTLIPTLTPRPPTRTPTPFPPTPTALPTSTPNLTPTIPPAVENTLIVANTTISLENIGQVVELGRWGKGFVQGMGISSDGLVLAVQTTAGQYLYNMNTFREIPFSQGIFDAILKREIEVRMSKDNVMELVRDGTSIFETKVDHFFSSIVLSSDNSRVALETEWNTITVWDLKSGEKLGDFGPIPGLHPETEYIYCGEVDTIAISPNNQYLAAGCYEGGAVSIWDIESGELLHEFSSGSYSVSGFTFSPDSQLIAGVLESGTIKVWRVSDVYEVRTFADSNEPWWSSSIRLNFAPDSDTLIGGSFTTGEVFAWQISTGKLLRQLHFAAPTGYSIDISPSGDNLAFSTLTGIGLLDIATGKVWDVIALDINTSIKNARVSLKSRLRSGPSHIVQYVGFSIDGKYIIYSDDDDGYLLKISDSLRLEMLDPGDIYRNSGDPLTILPNGIITIFETIDAVKVARATPVRAIDSWVFGIYAIAPDQSKLVKIYTSNSGYNINANIIDSVGNMIKLDLAQQVRFCDFSPDSKKIACISGYKVEVWSADDLRLLYSVDLSQYRDEYGEYGHFAFSPNGEIMAITDTSKNIYLWNASDGTFLRTLEGHNNAVGDLQFTADGTWLISSSEDGTIRVWGIP